MSQQIQYVHSCRHFVKYSATDIRRLDLFMRTTTCGFPLSAEQNMWICLFRFLLLCENERKFIYRNPRISLPLFIDSLRRVGVRYSASLTLYCSWRIRLERENFRSETFSLFVQQHRHHILLWDVQVFDFQYFCGDCADVGGFRQHHFSWTLYRSRSKFCILNLCVTSAWPMLAKQLKSTYITRLYTSKHVPVPFEVLKLFYLYSVSVKNRTYNFLFI